MYQSYFKTYDQRPINEAYFQSQQRKIRKYRHRRFLEISMPMEQIIIGQDSFLLKIAHLPEHRIGLSKCLFSRLPPNHGLLYFYGQERDPEDQEILKRPFVCMWVTMPLTVAWFDKEGKIIEVAENLNPHPQYRSFSDFPTIFEQAQIEEPDSIRFCSKPAIGILELPIGTNIHVGEQISGFAEILKRFTN